MSLQYLERTPPTPKGSLREFPGEDEVASLEFESFIRLDEVRAEYYSGGSAETTCATKWRKAPRNPSCFSDCKTPVSSCRDSDYEAWLADYYDELYRKENEKVYEEKMTDTCELEKRETPRMKTPTMHAFATTAAKDSTKYWGIKEIRRHWPLPKSKTEYLLFPSIHPLLNVSSRFGRYLAMLHSSSAIPEVQHKRILAQCFKANLLRAKVFSYQLAKVILCDNLASISWFDYVTKKLIIKTICQLLRSQRHLKVVNFENAKLQQIEGIVMLCALSRDGGDTIKELHMWKMFAHGQCPVLKDTLSVAGRSKSKGLDVDLNYHFMEILNNFSSLTHLSVNYAYLANRGGDALLYLRTLRCGCLEELRLLCVPEERPLLTNPGYGVGGHLITDGVWRRAREWSPKMRVMFVFLNMPQYENIILFLSKNIPLSSFYLSSGVDFAFDTPWEIDTTLLELRNWYASTLDTLCLHLWHHRDLLDYVIQYRILDEFPNLATFEFIGILRCLDTLEGFCKRLLTRKYGLKRLLFWVEERYASDKKRRQMTEKMTQIRDDYVERLENAGIDTFIRTYPI